MKILRFLNDHLEEILCAVLLASMTVVIFLQILLRITGLPLSWNEEMGRYMFVWLIYIGCAAAVRKRKHISVELIDLFLKERGRFVISILSNVIFIIFVAILSYNGIFVVRRVAPQLSPAIRMSMAIPYSSFLVGSILMLFRLLQDTVLRFRERKESVSHD
ncbi:hypothetical protein SDC9_86506 [bioreactor metagenome]|uniref:Tripartite ATP-independent periplasmic transporters DctQ component domain-containing protein n=1 Tax=bioreactor metagenome TaxID=1076179 RepID=A0A644ZG95_9ZZZZ